MVRQVTFGGQNAEAYWSADGKHIVYQSAQPGYPDEQIFRMDADGKNQRSIQYTHATLRTALEHARGRLVQGG